MSYKWWFGDDTANVRFFCEAVVRVSVIGEVLAGEGEMKLVLLFSRISVWSTLPLAQFSSMLMGMVAGVLPKELPISLLY